MISAFRTRAICFLSTRVKCAGAFHLWQASVPRGTWTGIMQRSSRGQRATTGPSKDAPTHQKARTSTSHKHDYASAWSSSLVSNDTFPMEFFFLQSLLTIRNVEIDSFFCVTSPNHTIISRLYVWRIQNDGLFSKQTIVFLWTFVHCSLYASWYKPSNILI